MRFSQIMVILVKQGGYMEISQAIKLVELYGAAIGVEGFLEILEQMQMARDLEDLSWMNEVALNTVMRNGAAMFAPVEA